MQTSRVYIESGFMVELSSVGLTILEQDGLYDRVSALTSDLTVLDRDADRTVTQPYLHIRTSLT